MRVFVTGGNGFIGSAVVKELLNAGYQVLALARSDKSAESLLAAGAEVHHGSLEDLPSLKSGAAQCDGVIHLGFIHDFSNYAKSCETDRLAINAIGEALAGSGRPFVVTSGILLLKTGEVRSEEDAPDQSSAASHRAASEDAALTLATRGVRSSIIRLPPSVHGDGDSGFIPALISKARQTGVSLYINDGLNRWTAVHRLDAARLYRLVLEKGLAGSKYHGVADESVRLRDVAEIIGKRLSVPVVSKSLEEAVESLGWFGRLVASDVPASSALTRKQLGWTPSEPGLFEDMEAGSYFKE